MSEINLQNEAFIKQLEAYWEKSQKTEEEAKEYFDKDLQEAILQKQELLTQLSAIDNKIANIKAWKRVKCRQARTSPSGKTNMAFFDYKRKKRK
jgi:hypothetical protein